MADSDVSRLLPAKPVDVDRLEAAYREVLEALGQGAKEEVMRESPRRVAELWVESVNAPWVDVEGSLKCFPNPGMGEGDMVVVNDCHYVSFCEHHLAPAFGVAHVAYVPAERVVGYSKLKKALNYLARQPQLNERLLVEVLDFVERQLEPRGVGLVLQSVHCCIATRANAPMQEVVTVQGFRGCLRSEPWHNDFLRTVDGRKPLFLGS